MRKDGAYNLDFEFNSGAVHVDLTQIIITFYFPYDRRTISMELAEARRKGLQRSILPRGPDEATRTLVVYIDLKKLFRCIIKIASLK